MGYIYFNTSKQKLKKYLKFLFAFLFNSPANNFNVRPFSNFLLKRYWFKVSFLIKYILRIILYLNKLRYGTSERRMRKNSSKTTKKKDKKKKNTKIHIKTNCLPNYNRYNV